MKTNKILTAGAIALSMILTGCSASSAGTKDTKTTEVAKKKEVKTLGKKTKDSKSLKFTNITGKKITVFETKSSSEESFGDNLLDDGDAVKNKEERTLYYTVKENDKLDVKVGLQDQDKTFVFKDVDTEDTKKVDVSLKEDKVNLDVTKKDGSTATLTPSEDSVKTEEEKKDESEVKQEEKKEETAKADSSNKSNTSESKKNNTASTTNTSSNKNNTGSSSKPSNNNSSNSNSSKPAEHTHNWVAQTQTIHHDAVYETKYVVDQAAYDEQPDWKDVDGYICDNCHQEMFTLEEAQMHVQVSAAMGSGKCKSYHAGIVRIPPGAQNPIHHDEVGHYEQILVKDAWDETVNNGYKCSTCGATK